MQNLTEFLQQETEIEKQQKKLKHSFKNFLK